MALAPIAIGLAGLGIHGRRYADHLLAGDVAGARLAAVSRASGDLGRAFARERGLAWAPSPADLASIPGVDAVVVVLPPDLHPAVALACIDAGRPVLVEKPLAPDARAAAQVARRAEAGGVLVMVAQTLRFDPLVVAVRERVPDLGALRVVALNQRFEPAERDWIDDPGRGGCVLNTGIHSFDLLRFLTGAEPATVQCETGSAVTRRTDDQFVAALRLEPGGILATVDNARTTAARSGRIEIAGERGQVRADHVHRTIALLEGRAERRLDPVPPAPTVAAALRSFVDCVRTGSPPAVTAADGLAAVRTVEAALVSAREGRRVRLDEIPA